MLVGEFSGGIFFVFTYMLLRKAKIDAMLMRISIDNIHDALLRLLSVKLKSCAVVIRSRTHSDDKRSLFSLNTLGAGRCSVCKSRCYQLQCKDV